MAETERKETAMALRQVAQWHFNGSAQAWILAAGMKQNVACRFFLLEGGRRFPNRHDLDQLLSAVPPESKARVLLAYFSDVMPPSTPEVLTVSSNLIKNKEAPKLKSRIKLSTKTGKSLGLLRRAAEVRLETRNLLERLSNY